MRTMIQERRSDMQKWIKSKEAIRMWLNVFQHQLSESKIAAYGLNKTELNKIAYDRKRTKCS